MKEIRREQEKEMWAKWLEGFSLNVIKVVFLLIYRDAASYTLGVQLHRDQKVKGN